MTDILDIFSYPFMVNALLASLLASVTCGIMGTLVLCNRLVFLAGGISHAAYAGIGISFFLGLPMLPSVLGFSLFASMLMAWFTLRPEKQGGALAEPDAAVGVLWAAGMALGIILIELTPGYTSEFLSFLFGSILAVPQSDLVGMGIFDFLLLIAVILFRQGIWAISIDRPFAAARGIRTTPLYLLLIGLTAISAVMLIRIVGLILVLALLTIPAQIARRYCVSLFSTMVVASCLALAFCLSGLACAWFADISSGAAIIAVAACSYFVCMLVPTRRIR